MFFQYFLFSMLFICMFKGAVRGFSSAFISLIGTIIAMSAALLIYRSQVMYASFAFAAFGMIQGASLYVASIYKKSSWMQFGLGAVVGLFEFLLWLLVVTAVASVMNLAVQEFLETGIIQAILPYSNAIKWMFANLA